MANTMDRLRELGERMVARSQHCENTKDAIAMQEHAAELDAILRETQVDAGAVDAKTWLLDVMGTWDFTMPTRAFDEIVNRIAASATPRTEPAEGREACPWGGCGDCVGHEVTQPAGDGARVTEVRKIVELATRLRDRYVANRHDSRYTFIACITPGVHGRDACRNDGGVAADWIALDDALNALAAREGGAS